ncbi:MAG TPA: hypothetical protein VD866_13765 [Urbifossiella sp.]|nr:hypothetical protein [Urbifossiella sp.]
MRPPRSPSRDRSDRFTGFRGYVRIPDRYATAKRMALLAALVLTGLWLVVEFFHPRAAAFHTHGQLANPHAAWDHQCAACHVQHDVANLSWSNVLNARDRWHDLTCTKCHAGPAHHASVQEMGGEWAGFHDRCSNCHHDHGGRTASLTDIADSHCVGCHRDVPHATTSDPAKFGAFASEHLEFRALRDYPPGQNYTPRKLKFSHAVHMTPGMVTTTRLGDKDVPSGPLDAKRLKEAYSPDAVARYGPLDTGKGVELKCASCHQLDAEVPADGSGDLPRGQPRAGGAYYLPVSYDVSCKSCHPTVAPDGGRPENAFPIPHRLQPPDLAAFLRAGYWDRLAKHAPAAKAMGPGQRLDPKAAHDDLKATFGGEVGRLTANAQKWLATHPRVGDTSATGTCAKCHALTGTGAALTVAPLPQHSVWFPHAKFNHVSHRGLTCAECHPGTDRPAATPAHPVNEVEPIAIRGVDSCRACHAPAGHEVKLADAVTRAAGVRHRCTDCHRYHNGEQPLHGMGSPARDPRAPQSLAEFLKGGK